MDKETRIKLAVQKSGRLTDPSVDLLTRCGLKLSRGKDQLMGYGENMPLDVLFVRDDDIPDLVQEDVCDLGLVGLNVLERRNERLREKSLVFFLLLELDCVGQRMGYQIAKHGHDVTLGDDHGIRARESMERARAHREARQTERPAQGRYGPVGRFRVPKNVDRQSPRPVSRRRVQHVGQAGHEQAVVHDVRRVFVREEGFGHRAVAGLRDLDQEIDDLGMGERHELRNGRRTVALPACHSRSVAHHETQHVDRLRRMGLHPDDALSDAIRARKETFGGSQARVDVRQSPGGRDEGG